MRVLHHKLPTSKREDEASLQRGVRRLPKWQREREIFLQRIFTNVEAALQAGGRVNPSLRKSARRLRGRHYRTDASRAVRLSFSTLRRLFYRWRIEGRVALTCKVGLARHNVSAPVMIRLLNLCASRRWYSLLAAWNASGLERQPITYGQAVRYFSAANFRELQKQLAAIESARRELKRLVNHHTHQLRRRLPARLRRQRKATR